MAGKHEPDQVDVDSLIRDLQVGADNAKKLFEEIHAEPTLEEGSGERLIEDVAANLVKIREAAGLPSTDVAQLEKRMKRIQREDQA